MKRPVGRILFAASIALAGCAQVLGIVDLPGPDDAAVDGGPSDATPPGDGPASDAGTDASLADAPAESGDAAPDAPPPCTMMTCMDTLVVGQHYVDDLAVSQGYVYWIDAFRNVVARAAAAPPSTEKDLGGVQVSAKSLGVDTTTLYWTRNDPSVNVSSVLSLQVDAADALPTPFATAQYAATYLALDDTAVYWGTERAIATKPKIGGTVTPLAEAGIIQHLEVSGPGIYWRERLTAIMKSPKDGGAAVDLGLTGVLSFVVDGSAIYYCTGKAIVRVDLNGANPASIVGFAPASLECSLAVDATSVFYTTATGVYQVPKVPNSTATRLTPPLTGVHLIATEGSYVYFSADAASVDAGPGAGNTAIVRAQKR